MTASRDYSEHGKLEFGHVCHIHHEVVIEPTERGREEAVQNEENQYQIYLGHLQS